MAIFVNEAYDLRDSLGAKANFHEVVSVPGITATETVFINSSQANYIVTDASAVYSTADSTATLDIFRDRGTAAPGAGASVLSGTLALTGTANTVGNASVLQSGQASLNPGDRLSVKILTPGAGLAGLTVTIRLTRA